MSSDELVREQRGNVLVLRLNRPEARNALNPVLINGIGEAIIEAESDPEVRAIVLTGTGDRAFCARMDLRSFASGESTGGGNPEAFSAFMRLMGGDVCVPKLADAAAAFRHVADGRAIGKVVLDVAARGQP